MGFSMGGCGNLIQRELSCQMTCNSSFVQKSGWFHKQDLFLKMLFLKFRARLGTDGDDSWWWSWILRLGRLYPRPVYTRNAFRSTWGWFFQHWKQLGDLAKKTLRETTVREFSFLLVVSWICLLKKKKGKYPRFIRQRINPSRYFYQRYTERPSKHQEEQMFLGNP